MRGPTVVLGFLGVLPAVLAGCVEDAVDDLAPGLDSGIAQAPAWRVGDWWTYRFTSDIYDLDFEVRIVVGEASASGFLVGMPAHEYELGAILFHLPPLGRLTPWLGYSVHDVPFEPLRFPLVDNLTWDTTWIAAPVHLAAHRLVAVVEGAEPRAVWVVSNEGQEAESGRLYHLQYDPQIAWFTEFQRVELDGRVRERLELVDHGHDHVGTVRLLDGVTMVFLEGRTAVALNAGAPGAPVADFSSQGKGDTIFAACVWGDAAGRYEVEVNAPSRGVCAGGGLVTPDDPSRRFAMAEVPNESGTWQARLVAGGQGVAAAEVMAYRAWNVDLPPPVPVEG